MTYIKRHLDKNLIEWKTAKNRKPLLIRGARQVGKSSTIRNFAKQFDYFIEVNFEMQKTLHKLFDGDLEPHKICEELSVITNTPVIAGRTLVFFDEIQSCLPAISSLRFFYEKFPELHIVAAGSLLEFALQELPSFGVGRIRSLFLYPFSYEEYLDALGEKLLLQTLQNCEISKAFSDAIHKKLIDNFLRFMLIGGMPEVVATYVGGGSILDCQQVLDDLIISLYDDFAKYKENVPTSRLREVFGSVVNQTGGKFFYSKASSNSNHLQIKESIDLLELAGIIYPVTQSSSNGIPLAAEMNIKFRKYLIFDTGIFQRILGLNLSEVLLGDKLEQINKGALAELFVGLELIKSSSGSNFHPLFYWQRDARGSEAEVDYVIQLGKNIVPIEVKSGTSGAMQSLHLFITEKNCEYGIRTSLENIGQLPQIKIFPIYALATLIKKLQHS
jgi:predicted AAA+ superfamily ATPase